MNWFNQPERALSPFQLVKDHVLLRFAGSLPEADRRLKPRLAGDLVGRIVDLLPDEWLKDGAEPPELRTGYRRWLTDRLAASQVFVDEAERARTRPV